jgi:thermitase
MRTIHILLLTLLLWTNSVAGKNLQKEPLDFIRFKSWGVDQSVSSSINLEPVLKRLRNKKNIIVGVVDTGIDSKHPYLKDSVLGKYDFSGDKGAINGEDGHGHGTHVSGIVKSVYPGVKIIAYKYYNPRHSGVESLDATLAALEKAIDMNVDIINYSGGGPESSLKELRILKKAEKKGILVVCAAGNESSNIDEKENAFYPASYGLSNIISVTAHNQELQILGSSNYGRGSVDISAPGYRIRGPLPNNRSGYLTGTSQATAFVSGVAAMLMANFPHLNPMQVKQIILNSARKETSFAVFNSTSGRLDATRAYEMAERGGRGLAFTKNKKMIQK